MRAVITLLILALLVGCTTKEAVKDMEVTTNMPVPGIDVEETVVTGAEENTDLTTSENTFDALDEALDELE